MDAKISKIQNILENEYSNENFITLVKEIFPEMQLVAPDKFNEEFSNFSSYVCGYTHIGNYTTPDNKKVLVLSIQLKNAQYVENSRSAQRNFAKKLIENNHCDASFIAFYTKPIAKRDEAEILNDKDSKWRISFVKIDYSINFDNEKLKTNKSLTPAKRYSYLVGKGEPSHTAIERIKEEIIKKNQISLDDIENAFSVEKVTDEFFNAYTEKFNDLNDYLSKNDDFKHEALRLGLKPEEFSVQFSKKLLGQIVFLYFLQKKGWLGVNAWPTTITEKEFKHAYYDFDKVLTREYIPKLYIKDSTEQDLYRLNAKEFKNISPADESYLAKTVNGSAWGTGPRDFMRRFFNYAIRQGENKNFYDDYLEPLFYDALNNNRGEEGYWSYFHCRIPFLSGSLFEPINNYDWQHSKFDIPNEMFSNKKSNNDISGDGILDIFDRYNFTISEDEPMEKEVAIDPEMLGKVFESMLEVKDRKSKGAFYTPREIVHYMCQESLINYLTNNTGISQEAIRDFILYGEYIKSEDTNRNNNVNLLISNEIYKEDINGKVVYSRLKEIDDLLANIKVADPAVGSGAFPLGMLNEIVKARTTITDYMCKYENAYSKRLIYISERSIHTLKVETIKNSLFAVDLEPSAVEIAKLRLWLALVIDDEINPKAQNELEGHKNPLPLPNLECNILCGNSLIDEFESTKLIEPSTIMGISEEISFSAPTLKLLLDKLFKAEEKLFSCSITDDKIALKKEIEDTKFAIIKLQIISHGNASEEVLDKIYKIRNDNSKPFIVWELDYAKVFKDKKGFDIVIGNPPYVGEKGNKEIFEEIAKTSFGKKFKQGKMDLFYYFFHKGINLLNNSGELKFITTNYYITATGGNKLRTDFKERTFIRKLINFNEYKIFKSALGQHNIITELSKNELPYVEAINVKLKGDITDGNINEILYSTKNNENIERFRINYKELFDGKDNYIRITKTSDNKSITKIEGNDYLEKYCYIHQGLKSNSDKVTDAHLKKYKLDDTIKKGDGIFILNKQELSLLNLTEREKRFVKPLYKNSDIQKYITSNETEEFILYISKENYLTDEDIHLKQHFDRYKEILQNRAEVEPNGTIKLYSLTRPREQFMYETPKIVAPYKSKGNVFGYNESDWYASGDVYYINLKPEYNNIVSLKYILAVLNSKLYYMWFFYKGKRKGYLFELYQKPLSETPIIIPEKNIQLEIEKYVDMILNNSNAEDAENKINEIIYSIYNINLDEINEIEKEYSKGNIKD